MADERIRQVEREYSRDPTHENLGHLLNTYRRHGRFVNLVDLEVSFSLSDINVEPPSVCIYNDKNDPVFGPWELDDFKNVIQTKNVLKEVFQDAGLKFDPGRLECYPGRLYYAVGSYAEARNITDKLHTLGLPPGSVWAEKWVGLSDSLAKFVDENEIPFNQTQWRYSPEDDEDFLSPEGTTGYEYLRDLQAMANITDFKKLAWSITEQRNLLNHPNSPGLLHINAPIPEVIETRIISQQDMLPEQGRLNLHQVGYLPETFKIPEDGRQIMVALWRIESNFMGSIHTLDAAETQHFVDEIITGIEMRGEFYTQKIATEELETTLERNDIWDEVVWIPDVHW
jgi:hypothetical protein